MVAPLVGGVTGALIYKAFVELFHPNHKDRQPELSGASEYIPLDQAKKGNAEECVNC